MRISGCLATVSKYGLPAALALWTTACAHTQATPPSPYLAPEAGEALEGDGDLSTMRAQVLAVGHTYLLPRGAASEPVTWHVPDRDRHRVRLDGERTITPLVPGALTLRADAGGHQVWFHHAVRAVAPSWPELYDFALPEGRPAFERPVVLRDASAWARFATVWALRALGPPVTEIRDGRVASQVTVANLDFRNEAVLVVDVKVDRRFMSHPVFTHVSGDVVFLTIPGSWDTNGSETIPPRFDREREEDRYSLGGLGAYAFKVPRLPAGVRVALEAFPEADAASWVTGEPEVDVAPLIKDMAPAEVLPVELGPSP